VQIAGKRSYRARYLSVGTIPASASTEKISASLVVISGTFLSDALVGTICNRTVITQSSHEMALREHESQSIFMP